jgi:UrcA family protein
VNSAGSFTGNSGSFAEYRVSACRISSTLSSLKETCISLKEIVMKTSLTSPSKLAKAMLATSFLVLGGAAIGGNALALEPTGVATTNESVSYPVGYSDLDLSKMQGAKILYLRIRTAAETLCTSAATWGKKEGAACVTKAVDDAIVRIDRPLLSQYYQLRTKGDKAGLVQLAKAN